MDITKETKSTLLSKLEAANLSLTAVNTELAQTRLVTQKALDVANKFSANLFTIESLILDSPIGKGKFVKTLWFFITNWKHIVTLLEGIIEQIRLYKQKMEELKEEAQKATQPQ